ncbi:hypothetical protein [Heyndrickxia sporothermodurans]|uniref:hypothetical protein n=1 Tax=Heyndrickxia sporothermodurans TaxID=46224 RepID=UPI001F39528A|nr:hypothetical protein [Heyndrickxia sporothermodurans]
MTPVACWFVAYAVFIFCIAYYGKINPDFAIWLINKAEEAEQRRKELEESRRDKNSH